MKGEPKMNRRVTFISIFALLVLFITGSYISDKNPLGSKSNISQFEQQKPHIEIQSDDPPVYTDDFDGLNDTNALKLRGYIIGRGPGAGPMGLTALWFQGGGVFPAFNGPTTGHVAANYNATTGTNNIDSWLVLPRISGTGVLAGDSITFYSRAPTGSTFPDSIRVMYSTTDSLPTGTGWTELGRFKVNILGIWERKGFMAATSGLNGRFAIRYCVVGGGPSGANSDYIGIDALNITRVPPVCAYIWAPQTSGTTNLLYSVKSISNMVGWAAGAAATVRRTTDGGATWGNGNPNAGVINGAIYAIEALDANTAWCTTSPAATFIYKTTNGGTNWTQVFTQTGGFIDCIRFYDANTGLAIGDPVGGRWSIFKTINGGTTWDSTGLYLPQAGSEAGWNNAMDIVGSTAWLGTSNTRAYKTINTGSSWTNAATAGLLNGVAVHYNSATLGLIGGDAAPFIVRSTDGGATYGTVVGTIPGSGLIGGIEGYGNFFWALRSANILLSTASGDNFAISYVATGNLSHLDFAMVNGCPEGWAVGAGGLIVKMANLVGISGNGNSIPSSYSLGQNYPNPFNPTTKIAFSLPKAGNVEIKVFDILGREVMTLANEYRPAGKYQIEFNASSLSSGAYFYKIISGDFTDTKKILLVK